MDRYDTKILPAFGILWVPNPQTRFDIFFPQPKLAQYLTTLGNTDVWWYVNGEYGGGSWNVNMPVGNTNVDYNDIRVSVGAEWTTLGSWRGYLEVGYVFERELYISKALNSSLGDSFMVRGGIAF